MIDFSKIRYSIKNHTILYITLSFCLLALIAALFSIVYIYSQSRSHTAEVLSALNDSNLKVLSSSIDNEIMTFEHMYLQLSKNNTALSVLQKAINRDDISIHERNQISNEIHAAMPFSGLVDDVYIYFNNSDLVISNSSPMKKETAYNVFHGGDEMDFDAWNALMQEQHFDDMIPVSSSDGMKLAFMGTLPINTSMQHGGTFVALLNLQKMAQIIEKNISPQSNTLLFICCNNSLLFTNDKNNILDQSILFDTGNAKEINIGKETYIITRHSSALKQKLSYIAFTPQREILHDLGALRLQLILIIAILLLIWWVSFYYFVYKPHKPLQELTESLRQKLSPESSGIKNEVEIFRSSIDTLHSQINTLVRQTDRQHSQLEAYFLADWLRGKITSENLISENLNRLGLSFMWENYTVILFHIYDYSEMMLKLECSEDDNLSNIAHMVITNVIRDLFEKQGAHCEVSMDSDTVAMLWNIPSELEKSEDFADNLIERLNYAGNFIAESFFFKYTAYVSAPHPKSGISDAYYESLSMINERGGRQSVVIYSPDADADACRKFTDEEKYILENYIKTGDAESAAALLEQFFTAAAFPAPGSGEFLSAAKFNVMSTILNTLNAAQYQEFLSRTRPATALSSCTSFDAAKDELIAIASAACELCRRTGDADSRKSGFGDRLIEYIEENYSNPKLNVSTIAASFNFTAHYLSQQFKLQTGENLKTYISRYRVERAKELLKNPSVTIASVAADTGFTDANALIRAFKKFTGITPAKYRETGFEE